MEIIVWLFIGFVIFAVIVGFVGKRNENKKIKEIFANEENFSTTHEYRSEFNDNICIVAIDSNSQKIIFYEDQTPTIINFNDLISVETRINDEILHVTDRGSQIIGGAVGGLLLGPAGLLLGGLTGRKKEKKKIKKISIRVTISNLDRPHCDIVFYEGKPIKIDSSSHREYSSQSDEWIGRFTAILSQKNDHAQSA